MKKLVLFLSLILSVSNVLSATNHMPESKKIRKQDKYQDQKTVMFNKCKAYVLRYKEYVLGGLTALTIYTCYKVRRYTQNLERQRKERLQRQRQQEKEVLRQRQQQEDLLRMRQQQQELLRRQQEQELLRQRQQQQDLLRTRQEAQRRFSQETLPGIAQRFAGQGALSSSAFRRSMQGASRDLESQLRAQEAMFNRYM